MREMTEGFMTSDAIFGYMTNLRIADYFDPKKLSKAKEQIAICSGKSLVVGCGASLVAPEQTSLVYVDIGRFPILRLEAHANQVMDWRRDTEYVHKNLYNNVTIMGQGDGWIEEKTGLHP